LKPELEMKMNVIRQHKKADMAFRAYVEYFGKRLQHPDYEQEIRKNALETSGYEQREAQTIMENVVSINARRQKIIEGVKQEGKKRKANILFILKDLEKSMTFRVKILKEKKKCMICQDTIPYPREITCEYEYECESESSAKTSTSTSKVIVRSDFVNFLRCYFILYHYSKYIQYTIMNTEGDVDERFINEQYKVFMHCIKQCRMITQTCEFYIQDE
jgi:hypothetical protein